MNSTVVHHRWSDIPSEQINASIARQFITGERVTVARFELKRGGVVPRHAHENEQVSYIVSGALKFVFDDREVVVREGEVLQIPGHVPHARKSSTIASPSTCSARCGRIGLTRRIRIFRDRA